ncbi:MAG: hypothetical protein EBU26_03090 [Verrucomicrobia bacterium]|nr:hypothetical protein [Verrucomicrobiota bacterium]
MRCKEPPSASLIQGTHAGSIPTDQNQPTDAPLFSARIAIRLCLALKPVDMADQLSQLSNPQG